ncbi:MAG: NADP-dependent malic enzyme [Spirochaetes bacterium]|nr:NADP-dependent malic enzyme [Spirochaetota bacterium]
MNIKQASLKLHKKMNGKLNIVSKETVTKQNLPLLYTPGVAYPCLEIHRQKKKVYDYTIKKNTIAIVTDGTAVLGLGDIGPEAALPVMEGKAILFKEFGDVNAVPICLNTKDVNEIVRTVIHISPAFGGINLEDISAPRCFEIEKKLIESLDIPIFHDDQHGTAVVVYAGLCNALKLVKKKREEIKVVINGAGAAGIAITEFLLANKIKDIILCDSKGIISQKRPQSMNAVKKKIAKKTNRKMITGSLHDALKGADVFIGVSVGNILKKESIRSMNSDPVIFALANPTPEIKPDLAKQWGAKLVATGRSDFPNQINNLLAFPGIFKGTLEAKAKKITFKMKKAAAEAIANMIPEKNLSHKYFIPDATDKNVSRRVADAVKKNI